MTDPITPHTETGRATDPAMPRLAAMASRDLARSVKTIDDGVRAVEAWFAQHGDPFLPMDPAVFADSVRGHHAVLDPLAKLLTNAELLARLRSSIAVLSTRLSLANRGDE